MMLDLSAGNRAIWFDKQRTDCVFVDRRRTPWGGIVADSRLLPFGNGVFDLIIFDPPHVNAGKNSNISRSYGWQTTEEIRNLIKLTAQEAHRVAASNALMIFKWNDHDQRLGPVLALMSEWWDALCGHSVAIKMHRRSETFWAVLRRRFPE